MLKYVRKLCTNWRLGNNGFSQFLTLPLRH